MPTLGATVLSKVRRPKTPREHPKPIIRPKKLKPILPIDALRHPSLDRQDSRYIPMGPEQDVHAVLNPDNEKQIMLMPTWHPDSKIPGGTVIPERRRQRGPDAIIALFKRWHVSLAVVDGRLVASNSGGGQMFDSAKGLLRDATPLLAAHIAGEPLRCGFPHTGETPAAVSLVEPSMLPICGAHLDGDAE